ncbi:YegJ family protein [Tardiphaga sp. vice304]|uniref:YegJ family protein n=1 Tax=Tardiphaga sp. vice304 TaxID=2592817 RepID=UPI001FF047BB|nr:DUF2314 domain-containing protein [Tardiphaga sp. vice304]
MWRHLLAVALLSALSSAASSQQPGAAERDDIASVKSGDPAVTAAMQRARAELDGFLAIAGAPPPGAGRFSLKIRLPFGDDQAEYIWVNPFKRDGAGFVGVVASMPRNFSNLASGDRLAFQKKDIADWTYVIGERRKGNYTGCALLAKEPPDQYEALKKRYGLDCSD